MLLLDKEGRSVPVQHSAGPHSLQRVLVGVLRDVGS